MLFLGSSQGFYQSTNGGSTWTNVLNTGTSTNTRLFDNSYSIDCSGGGTNSQGWYDNTIAVDPTTPTKGIMLDYMYVLMYVNSVCWRS